MGISCGFFVSVLKLYFMEGICQEGELSDSESLHSVYAAVGPGIWRKSSQLIGYPAPRSGKESGVCLDLGVHTNQHYTNTSSYFDNSCSMQGLRSD